jgi:YbbR domain-containing protein
MNKLINTLFEKDLVIKIVSIMTAILIWFVVLDTNNPFEERTLAVPLTSNIDILQRKSLQLVGTQLPTSVDIKIKGRRSKISGVTANDFRITIDFSEVSESGFKRINIEEPEYIGDQDIIIVGINPTTVNLNFERIIGKQYPVNVEFTGSLPAGYEIINLKVEPSNVILEEKESSISQISKVVAFVNLDEADDNKELVIRGSVLDDNDQLLRQFEGKVPVIVTFNLAKKVPVAVATTGKPANDFYLKNIRYSMNELRIIGSRSVLEGIKSVSAEAIDITDKSESFTIPLVINPPKGVTVYKEDSDRLSAEVILEKSITRTFNISPGMVSIYGGDTSGAVEYRITDTIIPITVKGKVDDINAVKTADIRLSIRVNDLEPGQHEVPLIVSVPNTVNLIGEYSVNVMITTTPVTEPTPGL